MLIICLDYTEIATPNEKLLLLRIVLVLDITAQYSITYLGYRIVMK
jgi:hypothetical protein